MVAGNVTGRILLPEGTQLPESAVINVKIEDVSRADAASKIITQMELQGDKDEVTRRVQEEIISFSIPVEIKNKNATYVIRVHISSTGSNEVNVGDFISTQSHRVLTHGADSVVDVPVILIE